MLKLTVLLFACIGSISGTPYSCSCYCSVSYTYYGTAYANTCSSSACETACNGAYTSCLYSPYYTYGSCTGIFYGTTTGSSYLNLGGLGSSWGIGDYTNALSTGAIIAVVVGSLTGLAVFIATIVVIVICCKRKKRLQVWAMQTQQQQQQQQQQMGMQPSFISGAPQQLWTSGAQPYPFAHPMNGGHQQYPPAYSPAQPPAVHT